ncbi:hypothetical protein JCM5350_006256 [Sporobolomyces pararoseus]
MNQHLQNLWLGLSGTTVGLYCTLQRCFIAFGILSPVCFFIDAPFGKFTAKSNLFTMNGSLGWFLMEIVSPLAFVLSLPLGQSSAFPSSTNYLSMISTTIRCLPLARKILAALFLLHYLNRSTISTLQNPSRARMNLLVPLSAVIFNVMNGTTMGMWIGGGYSPSSRDLQGGRGLREGSKYQVLFVVGVLMWFMGFCSNIYHDQVLYDLKREKLKLKTESAKPLDPKARSSVSPRSEGLYRDPKTRYSIPPRSKGLYRYISHPSYSSEWFEWLGFLLASISLSTAPFPPIPLHFSSSSPSLTAALSTMTPFREWYLQPPALFLWQEIGVMLPRARAGHKWYEKTFGKKEWQEKGQRWVIIPRVY